MLRNSDLYASPTCGNYGRRGYNDRTVPARTAASRVARLVFDDWGVPILVTGTRQSAHRSDEAATERGNAGRGPDHGRGHEDGHDDGRRSGGDLWTGLQATPPRIAVYADTSSAPIVVPVSALPGSDADVPAFVEGLTGHIHSLAREQGGHLPLVVFQELIDNLVHASFREVVITILDGGNTVRISDGGPGIADKEAARRPGFTSADAQAKRFIRGVGSGFAVVAEALEPLGGTLELEDNLGRGTVVTAHAPPPSENVLAPPPPPSYNLTERQLKALLLAVELAPVGPTRLARELGVSTSTAYRDLVSLEEAGFVALLATGHRSVTEAGLAYLNALL